MTTIRIRETAERVFIHMKGHAGYDSTGRDIVCASCSVLIQSLVNALQVMHVACSWKQEPGEVVLTFAKEGKWQGAYTMARVGYEMLATSYPNNVKIEKGAG